MATQGTVKIPVEFQFSYGKAKEYATGLEKLFKDKHIDLLSEESVSTIKQIQTQYEKLKSIGDQMSLTSAFKSTDVKEYSRQLIELTKLFDKFRKEATVELKAEFSDETTRKLDNQLLEIEEQITHLEKMKSSTLQKATNQFFGDPAAMTKQLVTALKQEANIRDISGEFTTLVDEISNIKSEDKEKIVAELTAILEKRKTEAQAKQTQLSSEKGKKAQAERQQKVVDVYDQLTKSILGYADDVEKNLPALEAIANEIAKLNEQHGSVEQQKQGYIAEQTGNTFNEQMQSLPSSQNIKTGVSVGATTDALDEVAKSIKGVTQEVEKSKSPWDGFIGQFLKTQVIFTVLKQVFRETVRTITELDAAFNGISIVTGYTTKQVWGMYDSFQSIASVTGFTVKEISNLSLAYFRQGKSMSEVMKLTEAAASAAKIAGIDAASSVEYLTAAVNGYRMSANQAMEVSDKFAALSATSATDYEGLATALSKVAAQAYTVGVNMDSMMGFIAKALETTQEAPENIGTAFKTIFARMSEIKDFGATLEDGMDINRVEKALKSINVDLRNQSGEMRNLDEVLFDVGGKWDTLSKNQKAYITTALAGTRQQSRLLAVFEDFDRTMELVDASANSLGATYAQQAMYTDSLAFAMNELNVAWETLTTSFIKSDAIIFVVNLMTGLVDIVTTLTTTIPGLISLFLGMTAAVAALTVSLSKMTDTIGENEKAMVKWAKKCVQAIQEVKDTTAAGNAPTFWKQSQADIGKTIVAVKDLGKSIVNKSLKGGLTALLDIFKGVFGGIATAVQGAATAVWTFITTNPVGWIVGLAAAIGGVALAISNAKKAQAKQLEDIKKAQAELFNLNKKSTSLDSLLSQYDLLKNKIVKTNEDLMEMESIVQKISDLGFDNLIDSAGGLSEVATKMAQQQLDKEINKQYNTIMTAYNRMVALSGMAGPARYENQTEAQKIGYETSEAIKVSGAKDAAEFSKYTAAAQKSAIEFGKALAQNNIVITQSNKEIIMNLKDEWEKFDSTTDWGALTIDQASEKLSKFFTDNGELAEKLIPSLSEAARIITEMNELDWSIGSGWTLPDVQEVQDWVNTLGVSGDQAKLIMQNFLSAGDIEQGMKLLKSALATGGNALETFGINANDAMKLLTKFNDKVAKIDNSGVFNMARGLQSLTGQINDFAEALTAESFNLETIDKIAQELPDIWAYYTESGFQAEQAIESLTAARQAALDQEIEQRKAEIQLQIERLKGEKQFWEDQKTLLTTSKYAMNQESFERAQESAKIAGMVVGAEKEAALKMVAIWKKREEIRKGIEEGRDVTGLESELASLQKDLDAINSMKAPDKFADRGLAAVQEMIDGIDQQIKNYEGQLNFLNSKIWTTLTKSMSKEQAQEFKDGLSEFFNIDQQLKENAYQLELIDLQKEKASINELMELYGKEMLILQNNVDLYKQQADLAKKLQEKLISGNKGIASYFDITDDGRILLNMEKYQKATDATKEQIKDFADAYDDLTDKITEANKAMKEQEKQMEEIVNNIADQISSAITNYYNTIVQMQESIFEVLKEAQQKEFEAQKKAKEEYIKQLEEKYDAEIEFLNKRKELYEEYFSEEDYQNELADMESERSDIISQLAALEGATDATSLKRKAELQKKLEELNKNYNDKVTEYNRDAVLDRLDQEITATEEKKDEVISQEQEQFDKWVELEEERINNIKNYEEEINRIMAMSYEERLEWYSTYVNSMDDKTEAQKNQMINAWLAQEKSVRESSQAFSDAMALIEQLKLTNKDVTNIMIGNYESLKLKVKEYISTLNSIPSSKTTTVTTVYKAVYEGEAPKTAPTTGTGSTTQTGSSVSINGDRDKNDSFLIAPTTNSPLADVILGGKDLNTAFGSLGRSIDKNTEAQNINTDATKDNTNNPPNYQSAAYGQYNKPGFATGGSTEFTGWHWLDGKVGKPERVLSATQTEAFDQLVDYITANRGDTYNNGGISIGQVSISTNELNTAQDFSQAGRILAESFQTAISSRGININQRK